MILQLSTFEVMHAAQVGVARNVSALRDGRPLEHGRRDLAFERHIVGALGEYAVARALDVCWRPAVGRLDTETGDVAGYQVKSTTNSDGPLIVREHDPEEFPYVLAVVRMGGRGLTVNVLGYMFGVDAKFPCYWKTEAEPGVHRAAYFVPQADLLDFDTLRVRA